MLYKNMILVCLLISGVVNPAQSMESKKALLSLRDMTMIGTAFVAGIAATYFVWVRPKNKELNFFRSETKAGRLFLEKKIGLEMDDGIKKAGLNHLYKAQLEVAQIDSDVNSGRIFKIEKM